MSRKDSDPEAHLIYISSSSRNTDIWTEPMPRPMMGRILKSALLYTVQKVVSLKVFDEKQSTGSLQLPPRLQPEYGEVFTMFSCCLLSLISKVTGTYLNYSLRGIVLSVLSNVFCRLVRQSSCCTLEPKWFVYNEECITDQKKWCIINNTASDIWYNPIKKALT